MDTVDTTALDDAHDEYSDEFLAIYFPGGVLNCALERIDPEKLYGPVTRIPLTSGQHHEVRVIALLVRELKRPERAARLRH
jgi:hypothetical protein